MNTSYQQTEQCWSFLSPVLYFLDDLQTSWKQKTNAKNTAEEYPRNPLAGSEIQCRICPVTLEGLEYIFML